MPHPAFGEKPYPQFGTDGARGTADTFTADFNFAVGLAAGNHFADAGDTMYLTGDTRASSARIMQQVGAGLTAAGVSVAYVDTMPTPGLMYTTAQGERAAGGIMVTASHNPAQDNGVKIVNGGGEKLDDATQHEITKLIVDGAPERAGGSIGFDAGARGRYEDFLVETAAGEDMGGLHIAIDTAHGAASGIAERVFTRLGANVLPLFDTPNGLNINQECGATHTAPLQARVAAANGKLVGAALDGDADRLMMVDERGNLLTGDHILYILAKTQGLTKVVATSMTNMGAERAMAHSDPAIQLIRTDVGDRYVLEGMYAEDALLGGEQSGHIIMRQFLHAGDGLLAAIQTMRAVHDSGKPLSWWYDQVPMFDQSLVNIPLANRDLLQHPDVRAFDAAVAEEFGTNGRLLLRPSGTEPLLRVMVESDDAHAKAERIAGKLQALLASLR